MEKQTKILLGVGAVIAAYLILKPTKAVAQTDVVNKKLDIDSLERVPSPDDTPEMSLGGTTRTYKDKNGVIYKYRWSSTYPPRGKYTDTNGNQWDDNGNQIIGDNILITKKGKFQDCATPMAVGYSSYFDESLGRCVTKYTKPPQDVLLEMQLGNLTNW